MKEVKIQNALHLESTFYNAVLDEEQIMLLIPKQLYDFFMEEFLPTVEVDWDHIDYMFVEGKVYPNPPTAKKM